MDLQPAMLARTTRHQIARLQLRYRPRHGLPLLNAALHGDMDALEDLLEGGADPQAQDARGWTALHYATKCGRFDAAACLLAYGADHTLHNSQGRKPFDADFTDPESLHAVRQRYRRYRKRSIREDRKETGRVRQWIEALDRDGIVRISGLVGAEQLTEMHREFERFVRALDHKIERGEATYRHYDEREHWRPKDLAYITNDAFSYSPHLIKLCCDPALLAIAEHYVGRPPVIQRGVGMRYLPGGRKGNDQFQWHHDMEEKRLKIMVLLTDIDENDQCMSYILGSHVIYHPYRMFFQNECSPEYCRRHIGRTAIYNTTGKAGDIFLFDSNGAHCGNRNTNAHTRDAFFVEYTADTSDMWGCNIPRDFFQHFQLQGHNPFAALMAAPCKWDQPLSRKHPTWVENLPSVERWL